MEKKNTLLLTVIAVATLLVAVVGATFAYFASTVNLENNTAEFTAETAPMTSSFVATGTAFSLEVTADKMQTVDAAEGKKAAESTKGTMVVSYGSSVDETAMYCTYDIYFQWNGSLEEENLYVAHSPIGKGSDVLYASAEDVVGYNDPREFTIKASFESSVEAADGQNEVLENVFEEEVDWSEVIQDNERHKIASARIWSNLAGEENQTVHTWTFDSVFYNIPAYQNALAGKTFSGVFSVDNVQC